MSRSMPVQGALCLALLVPATARADFFNHRNVLPGERSALMAGAYAALSDDLAGAFYNPAGIAFVREPSISLSGTAYAVQINTRTEHFDGSPVPLRLPMNRFNAIPSTAGVTYALGERLVLAAAVFEGDHIRLSAIGEGDVRIAVRLPQGQEVFDRTILRVRIDSQTTLAGPSVAYRFNEALSAGLSLHYHYYQGALGIAQDFESGSKGQVSFQAENAVWSGGLMPTLGSQLRAGRLQLGLAWSWETIPLHGANAWAVSLVSTGGASSLEGGRVRGDMRYPHRLVFGAAWVEPSGLTLAADVVAYLPLEYEAPHEILKTSRADNRHREAFHFDASVGAELPLHGPWRVRCGLYTNTSGATDQNASERVHLFGGTLGVGYAQGGLVSGLGLGVAFGESPRQPDFESNSEVSWRRLHFQLLYGGTHRFLEGLASRPGK